MRKNILSNHLDSFVGGVGILQIRGFASVGRCFAQTLRAKALAMMGLYLHLIFGLFRLAIARFRNNGTYPPP